MAASRKHPLTPQQRQQRSVRRRETAKTIGLYAGGTALYAGVGYGYYRMMTTPDQRQRFRSTLGMMRANPGGYARNIRRYATIYNARFKTQAQRGAYRVSARVQRPFSPQAKFNRYYNRRTQKQMFGMRVTAARMRVSNARSYKNYSRGRFGNMVNTTAKGRSGRVRRDYKGRFAGWM